VSYKTGFFLSYQLLDALYNADEQNSADSVLALGAWYTANQEALDGLPEFTALRDPLTKIRKRIKSTETTTMRDYNTLRAPLVELLNAWVGKMQITIFLQPDMPTRETLCINKATPTVIVRDGYAKIPDTDENSIHISLSLEPETLDELEYKIDVNLTTKELFKRAEFCFPMDTFDYDRLYLSGKLQSLSTSRNDTSIILAGSSYAMVGLKESLMPRPAVNLAVNAQDPYFTFLSVKNAKKYCSKIDTIVIAGGYYFWHTDMSDNPSDYYKSVLTRTNYPVLKKLHNYDGEILPQMLQSSFDPFLEKVFDLSRIYKKEYNRISLRLAALEYYNPEFNKRPANGMLTYPFREQIDEINDKAAETRAQAHNRNFNRSHLEENIREFSELLTQMEKKRVKVIILIPPATKFYRKHSSPDLRETLYESLEPVKNDHDFTFLDLFDSPDFDLEDFQDYDHLYTVGAEKLSGIVAGMV
jgi:hypothetical protein